MNLFRSFLLCVCVILPLGVLAQEREVFTWNAGHAVVTPSLVDHPERLYHCSFDTEYATRSYQESVGNDKYIITIHSPSDFQVDESYEVITIKNVTTGDDIFVSEGAYGSLSADAQFLTGMQSHVPYLKLPLDGESFALLFAGLLYTGNEAPEMMVVVVRGNEAKIVFDKMAFVYKYTPYPNYSAEYVEDIEWFMQNPGPKPPASMFDKLKRFKIWQEGNILKYKPLN